MLQVFPFWPFKLCFCPSHILWTIFSDSLFSCVAYSKDYFVCLSPNHVLDAAIMAIFPFPSFGETLAFSGSPLSSLRLSEL